MACKLVPPNGANAISTGNIIAWQGSNIAGAIPPGNSILPHPVVRQLRIRITLPLANAGSPAIVVGRRTLLAFLAGLTLTSPFSINPIALADNAGWQLACLGQLLSGRKQEPTTDTFSVAGSGGTRTIVYDIVIPYVFRLGQRLADFSIDPEVLKKSTLTATMGVFATLFPGLTTTGGTVDCIVDYDYVKRPRQTGIPLEYKSATPGSTNGIIGGANESRILAAALTAAQGTALVGNTLSTSDFVNLVWQVAGVNLLSQDTPADESIASFNRRAAAGVSDQLESLQTGTDFVPLNGPADQASLVDAPLATTDPNLTIAGGSPTIANLRVPMCVLRNSAGFASQVVANLWPGSRPTTILDSDAKGIVPEALTAVLPHQGA